jgi:putative transposase
MGRSRYRVVEDGRSYFITSSTIHWLPLFAVPALAEIVMDSLNFLQQQGRIKLHAWVLMETHFHLVATSQDMSGEMRKVKSYTARRIVDCLKKEGPAFLLNQLRFLKKRHKDQQMHQVWQEGVHPKMIMDERMLGKTIEYVHYNPVKRGYVDTPEHWRYSSARDYGGQKGLVSVDNIW